MTEGSSCLIEAGISRVIRDRFQRPSSLTNPLAEGRDGDIDLALLPSDGTLLVLEGYTSLIVHELEAVFSSERSSASGSVNIGLLLSPYQTEHLPGAFAQNDVIEGSALRGELTFGGKDGEARGERDGPQYSFEMRRDGRLIFGQVPEANLASLFACRSTASGEPLGATECVEDTGSNSITRIGPLSFRLLALTERSVPSGDATTRRAGGKGGMGKRLEQSKNIATTFQFAFGSAHGSHESGRRTHLNAQNMADMMLGTRGQLAGASLHSPSIVDSLAVTVVLLRGPENDRCLLRPASSHCPAKEAEILALYAQYQLLELDSNGENKTYCAADASREVVDARALSTRTRQVPPLLKHLLKMRRLTMPDSPLTYAEFREKIADIRSLAAGRGAGVAAPPHGEIWGRRNRVASCASLEGCSPAAAYLADPLQPGVIPNALKAALYLSLPPKAREIVDFYHRQPSEMTLPVFAASANFFLQNRPNDPCVTILSLSVRRDFEDTKGVPTLERFAASRARMGDPKLWAFIDDLCPIKNNLAAQLNAPLNAQLNSALSSEGLEDKRLTDSLCRAPVPEVLNCANNIGGNLGGNHGGNSPGNEPSTSQGIQIGPAVFMHVEPWPAQLRSRRAPSAPPLFAVTFCVGPMAYHSIAGVTPSLLRFVVSEWLPLVALNVQHALWRRPRP